MVRDIRYGIGKAHLVRRKRIGLLAQADGHFCHLTRQYGKLALATVGKQNFILFYECQTLNLQ